MLFNSFLIYLRVPLVLLYNVVSYENLFSWYSSAVFSAVFCKIFSFEKKRGLTTCAISKSFFVKSINWYFEYHVTFPRIVRIGSKLSAPASVGGFGLEPVSTQRAALHGCSSPAEQRKAKQCRAVLLSRAPLETGFSASSWTHPGFLRHILSGKLSVINLCVISFFYDPSISPLFGKNKARCHALFWVMELVSTQPN